MSKNVVITKEYLDKIRGYAAIEPEEVFDYVPEAFRELPEDIRPVFSLRPVAGDELVRMEDTARGRVVVDSAGESTIRMERGAYTAAVCRKGVVGWRRYYNLNGESVPYSTERHISVLPPKLLYELCNAILGAADLTDEERLGLKSSPGSGAEVPGETSGAPTAAETQD